MGDVDFEDPILDCGAARFDLLTSLRGVREIFSEVLPLRGAEELLPFLRIGILKIQVLADGIHFVCEVLRSR